MSDSFHTSNTTSHHDDSDPAKSYRMREARTRRLFDIFDSDHTGFLTESKLKKGFQNLDSSLQNEDHLLHTLFRLLDRRKSGHVQYDDFLDYVRRSEDELFILFAELDKEHSGYLKKSQLLAELQHAGVHISQDEFDQFFDSLDRNDDGLISYDEWRDYLLFIPHCSSLLTAYNFFVDDLDVSSEGDVLVSEDTLHGIGYFLCGGMAGAISRTATAPFDRIKVYLITTGRPIVASGSITEAVGNAVASKAKGPLRQAISDIWSKGGMRGFFVGNGLNVLKVMPESALKFGTFEAVKRAIARLLDVDPTELPRPATFLAGGIGGAVAQISIYPIDTLKYRLQCEAGHSKLQGNALIIDTARKMWQNGGLKLYYRGLALGIGGIFPFAAMDLGIFELSKRAYIRTQAIKHHCDISEVSLHPVAVLTMGAFSGSVGASAVYPINLLRTRLQTQGTSSHPYTYTGFRDVFQKTVSRDGYAGLYRGLLPNLAKVAPAVSISYLVYENMKRLLGLE